MCSHQMIYLMKNVKCQYYCFIINSMFFLDHWINATYRKHGKEKSVLGPVLICKSFHNIENFLLYDIYFFLNLLYSWSMLTFYTVCFVIYHTPSSRCVKYVLKTFQTKWDCLKLFLEKGFSLQQKGTFVWKKGTWISQRVW